MGSFAAGNASSKTAAAAAIALMNVVGAAAALPFLLVLPPSQGVPINGQNWNWQMPLPRVVPLTKIRLPAKELGL